MKASMWRTFIWAIGPYEGFSKSYGKNPYTDHFNLFGGLHRLRIQVFRSSWWMMHYGSLSPKRHMCLTNNPYAEKFNKGKLSRSEQKAKTTRKTVVKYVSKDGRPSYKGSDALKATQSLDFLQGWC